MKKSINANINGTIFNIDEDAFSLLNTYFEQLRLGFPGPDGIEIAADIEARAAELLSERAVGPHRIVSINDVNAVIERLGSPEQLNESDATANPETDNRSAALPPPYVPAQTRKRLYRDESNRVLGGVISGLGEYYNWNISLLRVLAVILALTTWFMPCFIAYIIAWCVIPAAVTPVQKLEMAGSPINTETLGRQMLDNRQNESASSQIGRIIGIGLIALLGLCCLGFFITMGLLFIISTFGIIGISVFQIPFTLPWLEFSCFSSIYPVFLSLFSLAWLLPLSVALWGVGIVLFKLPRIKSGTLIGLAIAETVLIIATVILSRFAYIP